VTEQTVLSVFEAITRLEELNLGYEGRITFEKLHEAGLHALLQNGFVGGRDTALEARRKKLSQWQELAEHRIASCLEGEGNILAQLGELRAKYKLAQGETAMLKQRTTFLQAEVDALISIVEKLTVQVALMSNGPPDLPVDKLIAAVQTPAPNVDLVETKA
jgi:chromosome segregation ATPase